MVDDNRQIVMYLTDTDISNFMAVGFREAYRYVELLATRRRFAHNEAITKNRF